MKSARFGQFWAEIKSLSSKNPALDFEIEFVLQQSN